MSLINQMLKDLDARQPLASRSAENFDAVTDVVEPVDWLRIIVWFITITLVGAYLIYTWWFEQQPELTESVQTVMPVTVQPVVREKRSPAPPALTAQPRSAPVQQFVEAEPEVAYLPLKLEEPQPVVNEALPVKKPAPKQSQVAEQKSEIKVKPAAKTPLQQSRAWIAEGRLTEAENLLRKTLNDKPSDALIREILIGLLLRSQRYDESEKLLDTGLRFYPYRESFVLFKVDSLLRDNDKAGAIALLQKQLGSRYAGEKTSAMLAPLYQQQGDLSAARQLYESLLGKHPDNARYWMGLATVLDGQSEFALAANAYTTALQREGLTSALTQYARQRLQTIKLSVNP